MPNFNPKKIPLNKIGRKKKCCDDPVMYGVIVPKKTALVLKEKKLAPEARAALIRLVEAFEQ